jgi:hypothetical protein
VPLEPRSVRREDLPEREPSGLMFIIKVTVRPLVELANADILAVVPYQLEGAGWGQYRTYEDMAGWAPSRFHPETPALV